MSRCRATAVASRVSIAGAVRGWRPHTTTSVAHSGWERSRPRYRRPSLFARLPLPRSVLLEELGQPKREAGNDRFSIDVRIGRTGLHAAIGTIHGRDSPIRIDHPPEPNAGLEPLPDLRQHFAR